MKRSEALREIPEAVGVRNMQAPWWEAVVKYFEDRVGVKWDPEEEPLPERLAVFSVGDGKARPMVECVGRQPGLLREMTHREATEVVRRHNAWPKLRKRAEAWSDYALSWEILAILDGKEE